MKLIRWSTRAERDFSAIYDWIAADHLGAAATQCEQIIKSIAQLSRFPNSGRKARVRSDRELAVPRTPYIIRYRCVGETVLLISIKHGSQAEEA